MSAPAGKSRDRQQLITSSVARRDVYTCIPGDRSKSRQLSLSGLESHGSRSRKSRAHNSSKRSSNVSRHSDAETSADELTHKNEKNRRDGSLDGESIRLPKLILSESDGEQKADDTEDEHEHKESDGQVVLETVEDLNHLADNDKNGIDSNTQSKTQTKKDNSSLEITSSRQVRRTSISVSHVRC